MRSYENRKNRQRGRRRLPCRNHKRKAALHIIFSCITLIHDVIANLLLLHPSIKPPPCSFYLQLQKKRIVSTDAGFPSVSSTTGHPDDKYKLFTKSPPFVPRIPHFLSNVLQKGKRRKRKKSF